MPPSTGQLGSSLSEWQSPQKKVTGWFTLNDLFMTENEQCHPWLNKDVHPPKTKKYLSFFWKYNPHSVKEENPAGFDMLHHRRKISPKTKCVFNPWVLQCLTQKTISINIGQKAWLCPQVSLRHGPHQQALATPPCAC